MSDAQALINQLLAGAQQAGQVAPQVAFTQQPQAQPQVFVPQVQAPPVQQPQAQPQVFVPQVQAPPVQQPQAQPQVFVPQVQAPPVQQPQAQPQVFVPQAQAPPVIVQQPGVQQPPSVAPPAAGYYTAEQVVQLMQMANQPRQQQAPAQGAPGQPHIMLHPVMQPQAAPATQQPGNGQPPSAQDIVEGFRTQQAQAMQQARLVADNTLAGADHAAITAAVS